MAKQTNKYIGSGSAGNNDGARRAKAAKEGKCQWCGVKVPLEEQFVVFNDFEKEKTIKSKNAAKPGREKLSHYCGPDQNDCAEKRRKIKQAGDFDKATNGGKRGRKKGSTKKAAAKPAKKVAKKKTAAAKPKGGKKRKVVRRKKVDKAASSATADPF